MRTDVLVLDIGKTHMRAITFDAAGKMISREQASSTSVASPRYRSLPIADVLTFSEAAIARAASVSDRLAVIPVTHGAVIALVDKAGLVLPVLDYEDPGPEHAINYDAQRPPFAETFSPTLPLGLNLGRQLAWLEQEFPAEFTSATAFLTLPQFIGWHFAGQALSEPTSLGCHTDLWAPSSSDFSTLAYSRGWRRRFPPVRDAGETIGSLRPELSKRLGIGSHVTIKNGLHDSNASLVPHLDRADVFTMISSGTWIISMAVGSAVDPTLPAARDCLVNVDVRGRSYPCARFMGGREFAVLVGEAPAPTMADLPEAARAVGENRFILPSHAGGGGPFPQAMRAAPSMKAAERAALATLYLAMMTATDIHLIGASGPIVIEGPAAANPLFGALLQALYPDRDVAVSDDTDATARGAALLALGLTRQSKLTPAARVTVPGLADYAMRWRTAAEASA